MSLLSDQDSHKVRYVHLSYKFQTWLILVIEETSMTVVKIHGIVFDEEDINEVQLQGEIDTFEFWRQKDVVQDLERELLEKLSSSPIFSRDAKLGMEPESLITAPTSPPPKSERRGFFGRRSSAKQPMRIAAPVVAKAAERNPMEVKVGLEEVCMRTVSSLGLYGTVTRPAIVVRVNANC